ncbi:MAG: SUMF1/EgtB/PvdO family nonheme iron enzyme [Verrucomicrobiota bacterium]
MKCAKRINGICIFFLISRLLVNTGLGNNVTITNMSLLAPDTVNHTRTIRFDIRWENSWRDEENYDAVWVFLKYTYNGGSTWSHGTLNNSGTNPAGFSQGAGTGLDIVVPSDKKGAFLQRTATGEGSVGTTGLQFVWNYGTDLTNNDALAAISSVRVTAIEMVYVPEGAFYVGSGGTEYCSFTEGEEGKEWENEITPSVPFCITNEAALAITNRAGGLWAVENRETSEYQSTIGPNGELSAAFPKGYAAFYCMKYQITQGQYADFLNQLATAQATSREIHYKSGYAAGRGTIGNTVGVYTSGAPTRACNFLKWTDGAAYMDWAALRPMSELEYEKACRGTNAPVANEYAWGSTSITQQTAHVGTDGSGTETASPVSANCMYGHGDIVRGPVRVGIYATGSSSREAAGATFYGIMEMSGNLYERIVAVGGYNNSTPGRDFTGTHGDGELDASGEANVTSWPDVLPLDSIPLNESSTGYGIGFRGGNWSHATLSMLCTSSRYMSSFSKNTRANVFGFRGVRTAP